MQVRGRSVSADCFGIQSRWNAIGTVFASKTNISKFNEFVNFVNVKTVTAGAFMNSTLAEIEFPNVTNIQWNVFRNDTHLLEATLPSTVTYIGEHSFSCLNMTKLTILATTPPTIINPLGPTTILFYVPAASLDTYKSAEGWSTVASRIYAIPE